MAVHHAQNDVFHAPTVLPAQALLVNQVFEDLHDLTGLTLGMHEVVGIAEKAVQALHPEAPRLGPTPPTPRQRFPQPLRLAHVQAPPITAQHRP